MPRPAKGPRLHLRKRTGRDPVFVILDGKTEISTQCGPEHREQAEKSLLKYIEAKWQPPSHSDETEFTIADALASYANEHAPRLAAPEQVGYAMTPLLEFWQDRPVSDIDRTSCAEYVAFRNKSKSTTHRELSILTAALNHCVKERYLKSAPFVHKPGLSPPRTRWLTRNEVARLIWEARKNRRTRHVAWFILVAVYTGTRQAAILNLGWEPSSDAGHIDLEQGWIYRAGSGERETAKKRPPARLPRKLWHLLKFKRKNSANFVIEYQGRKVQEIKSSWAGICERAKVEGVTRHTLKHTSITWAMQNAADPVQSSGFFGTSMTTIEGTYLHHHPDYQNSVLDALDGKTTKS